jgi:hypothetical protein
MHPPADRPRTSERFVRAIEEIDAANRKDPSLVVFDGRQYPSELLYGQRMTEWLGRLEPIASEALRLAVRCQHICRWQLPRNLYPMTRAGYLEWRTLVAKLHAGHARHILREVGYEEPMIARVAALVRKEGEGRRVMRDE